MVAKVDIAFGDAINGKMLQVRSWPADAVPKGAFTETGQVLGADDEKPRRAKRAIVAGDLIIDNKISDFGEQVTITQKIDPYMRAVAIRVNDVTGVAGFVAPTDRVDITLTRTVDQGLSASTILQDVEILAIDQAADGVGSKPSVVKTVTVQVKPGDAQKLALAQQAGTLSLSLRHRDASDRPSLESISVGDLADEKRPKPKPKAVTPTRPSIAVIRGGERVTVEVPRS